MRIGVDFGGSKIEAAALALDGRIAARARVATPDSYDAAIGAVRDLIEQIEAQSGVVERIGIGIPGTASRDTGLVRNANARFLNGRPFASDLSQALDKAVRLANDGDCFALSEAVDGAGEGAAVVFGAILGTGCGGGIAIDARPLSSPNGIAGEWGHNPLPGIADADAPTCWCGHAGCLETWISGSGFARDFRAVTGRVLDAPAIVAAARQGDAQAIAALDRYVVRLGRAIAGIVNILDPDIIVLGGGMSNVDELYGQLGPAITPHIFADEWRATVRPARWGDASGVRGAARLWN